MRSKPRRAGKRAGRGRTAHWRQEPLARVDARRRSASSAGSRSATLATHMVSAGRAQIGCRGPGAPRLPLGRAQRSERPRCRGQRRCPTPPPPRSRPRRRGGFLDADKGVDVDLDAGAPRQGAPGQTSAASTSSAARGGPRAFRRRRSPPPAHGLAPRALGKDVRHHRARVAGGQADPHATGAAQAPNQGRRQGCSSARSPAPLGASAARPRRRAPRRPPPLPARREARAAQAATRGAARRARILITLGPAHVAARFGLGDRNASVGEGSQRATTGARQPWSTIVPAQSKTTALMVGVMPLLRGWFQRVRR